MASVFRETTKTREFCFPGTGFFAIAMGKYIAILDSDDIALADRLEKQVAFQKARPDHCSCGSFYRLIERYYEILTSA
jgi:hypothetical protein